MQPMALGIIAVVLLAAPPTADELAQRRARVSELHQLADARDTGGVTYYLEILKGLKTPWELSTALGALGPHHKHQGAPVIAALLNAPGTTMGVKRAAAIAHYRWTADKRTLAVLSKMRASGASLRQAFQTGHDRGRPLYHKTAAAFFRDSAKHALVHTRLDGALGLIEIGTEPHHKEGIAVLTGVLKSANADHRALAVQHMSVSYPEPAFRPLLERATSDPDLTVQARASQILGRLK